MRFQIKALACTAVLCLLLTVPAFAGPPSQDQSREFDGYRVMDLSEFGDRSNVSNGFLTSNKAGTDSFYIYGGPGTLEGRFEQANGAPDTQGWTSVDLTEPDPHWRASTTNAATLGNGTLNNHAVICHVDESQGHASYTGYGNSWNDWLVWRIDLAALGYDPSQDSVDLRFAFDYVHDTEPIWDFLHVDWNRAGAYQTLLSIDGSSYVDSTGSYEPVHFDSGVLSLAPADYLNGEIWLRVRVTSDIGWSDEDGIFTTDGRGAAALDDIEVFLDEVLVSLASWEPLAPKADLPPGEIAGHDNGADTGTGGWMPMPGDPVGDFAKLVFDFQDLDPCRENRGWQYGFIDDGTPPLNDAQQRSTGGSISSTWSYGIDGGWVVNYTGGHTNFVTPTVSFPVK